MNPTQEQKKPEPVPELRPLGDSVIIVQAEAQKMTAGTHGVSLHIAERAQDERCQRYGYVVAVGHGKRQPNGDISMPEAQLGDLVAYPASWRGREFDWKGRTFRVLDPDDAMAIIGEGVYYENQEM